MIIIEDEENKSKDDKTSSVKLSNGVEEFYSQPDEALKKRRFIEYKTRFIDPFFPKDRSIKIVDLACGYGLFLDTCKKLGYVNYEGVEQIDKFVNYANKELDLKNIIQGDVFNFLESKNDNHFDIITAFNIVEHIKKDKVQYLINLINKKVKSGGFFIIEVPNADSPLGVKTLFSDLTHEFAFSRKLLIQILSIAGFGNIKIMYQPMRRNPFIKLGQKILAKLLGSEYPLMFSGNIIAIGYKK